LKQQTDVNESLFVSFDWGRTVWALRPPEDSENFTVSFVGAVINLTRQRAAAPADIKFILFKRLAAFSVMKHEVT